MQVITTSTFARTLFNYTASGVIFAFCYSLVKTIWNLINPPVLADDWVARFIVWTFLGAVIGFVLTLTEWGPGAVSRAWGKARRRLYRPRLSPPQ